MLTVSMLLTYADNREQNLQTLYRMCKKFVAAYEDHERVKAAETSLLANTQSALEEARQAVVRTGAFEENSLRAVMERAAPARRKR